MKTIILFFLMSMMALAQTYNVGQTNANVSSALTKALAQPDSNTVYRNALLTKLNKSDSTIYLTPFDARGEFLQLSDSTLYWTLNDGQVALNLKLNKADSTGTGYATQYDLTQVGGTPDSSYYLTVYDAKVQYLEISDSTIYLTPADGNVAYQPKEATLTDIADGTIAENLVNTANPWAENEVVSTLATETEAKGFIHDSLSNAETSIHTMAQIDTAVARVTRGLDSSSIKNGTLAESDLKIDNAPVDEYVLTYEVSTGNFVWEADETGGAPDSNNVFLTINDAKVGWLEISDSTIYLTPADNNVLLAAKLNKSDSTIYLTPADANVAYQPKDADLTDLADGSLTFTKVAGLQDSISIANAYIDSNYVLTSETSAWDKTASDDLLKSDSTVYLTPSDARVEFTQLSDSTIYLTPNDAAVAYQPKDADLTDLADGSLTASKVAGVADADYGDVTVSSGAWAVEDDSHNHIVSNTDGLQDTIDALQATDALKAPLASPTFTGAITHAGIKIQTHSLTTDSTLAAALCYGGVFYVPEAQTITLPAVASGMSLTFITVGAVAVSIDVNGSDKMWLDGTALADGDKATNTSTTGDIIVFTYYSADGWYAASGSNDGDLWTDGN